MKLWTNKFILLCIANFLIALAFYTLIATLPIYLNKNVLMDRSHIGFVMSCYTIASLIIRPIAGYLTDNFNKKVLLFASLLMFTALFLGYSIAIHLHDFVILRLLHGLTWGVLTTALTTVVIDVLPPSRRGEGIGIFGLTMTIGMAISPVIAFWIIGVLSHKLLFVIACIISFCGFLVTMPVQIVKHKKELSKFTFHNMFSRKALPMSLGIFFATISYGAILSFISLYAAEKGISQPGNFFLLIAIGLTIARFSSGRIFDKKGPFYLNIAGYLIVVLGLVMLVLINSVFSFYATAFVLGIGYGILIPSSQAMINNLVEPEKRGAANSSFLTFFDMGIGVGMLLVGYLAGVIKFSGAYLVCAGIVFVGLLFFIFYVAKHYERHRIK